MTRMQRLKRVFAIDIERCRRCGGRRKVIASIEDPSVIGRILDHCGWVAATARRPLGVHGESFELDALALRNPRHRVVIDVLRHGIDVLDTQTGYQSLYLYSADPPFGLR